MNRQQIIDRYWLEFLRYVKKYNDALRSYNPDGLLRSGKKPSVEAFWGWYIEDQLADHEDNT